MNISVFGDIPNIPIGKVSKFDAAHPTYVPSANRLTLYNTYLAND